MGAFNFKFSKDSLDKLPADLLFAVVFEKNGKKAKSAILNRGDGGVLLDELLNGELLKALRDQEFSGKEGETFLFNTFGKTKAKNILVAGLGAEKKYSLDVLRRLGGKVAQTANKIKAQSAGGMIEAESVKGFSAATRLKAFCEGAGLAHYQFNQFKKAKPANGATLKTVWLSAKGGGGLEAACEEGRIFAAAANAARDLTNRPPNDLTPSALAAAAQEMASAAAKTKGYKNISCRVWGLKEIRAEKMGALLAVAQGSKEPPAFIHLSYKPSGKAKAKIAIVGKGITFDSGGLNLKTRDQEFMKFDMAGAAAVVGVFQALSSLKLNVAVEGFIASSENMPSGTAYRPGDIIQTRAGKTVEIINTDAEGRLVLADALDVACECKPDYIIDMATLTGGAAYALGELFTPVLSNDKKLAEKLLAAGEKAGEPSWRLPIVPDYKKGYLKGPADLKNSGSGTKASTIAGALFLEEFVRENKWAHMDIASTAWADEPTAVYSQVGATGNPVRTILYFLESF